MTCTDARKLLPGLALGDLDAEPAADVRAHLQSCAECRAEDASIGRTVGLLKAAPSLPPSTQRRSAAAAAMARAQAEQAERILVRRPRRWAPWATAAAFLLAVAAALSVRSGGIAFTVARITGAAELRDRVTGDWRPVAAGTPIAVGDRLVTKPGCVIRMSSGAVELFLDQDTSVEVVAPRRVTLDRGRLLAVAPASGKDLLVVTDTANNSAAVKGRVELSLREVPGIIGGSREEKGKTPELPDPRSQIVRSLLARVQSGEAALGGTHDQRLHALAGEEGRFEGGRPGASAMAEKYVGGWADSALRDR
jgi:hypothetical protein